MQRCISAPGEMAPQEGTTQFGHRDAHKKKNRQHRIQTSSSHYAKPKKLNKQCCNTYNRNTQCANRNRMSAVILKLVQSSGKYKFCNLLWLNGFSVKRG